MSEKKPAARKKAGSAPGGRKSSSRKTAAKSTRQSAESLTEYNRKRDFTKTAEPAGVRAQRTGALRFIIQKHAASQLHFDLRLELDGAMKSWAVPKGPSADPSVKRLALQVEDHPISYNTFEGTIPEGEYGGGTVMLWDTGTYTPDSATEEEDDEAVARAGYERGDFKITFHGKRMRGSYALIRTKGFPGRSSSKPSWLLIKHRDKDAHSDSGDALVTSNMTSVVSNRTMDEIRDAAKHV